MNDTSELKESRPKKKGLLIGMVSGGILLLAGFITVLLTVIIPSSKYQKGVKALENKEYEVAEDIFDSLKWKDSKKKLALIYAEREFEKGDYESGIDYIYNAGGFAEVSYDAGDGMASKSEETIKLDSYINNDSSLNGYTFRGWSLDSYSMDFDAIGAYLSLKAEYSLNDYAITYDLDGGTVSGNPSGYSITDTVTVKNPEKTGYVFEGWIVDGNATLVKDYSFTGETGNKSLKAVWTAAGDTLYTVCHYKEKLDGSFNEIPDETEKKHGTSLELTVAYPKSYMGFTCNEIEQKTINPDGSTVVNVYYERLSYTVSVTSLSSRGGEISGLGTYKYGESVDLSIVSSYLGYDFTGWILNDEVLSDAATCSLEVTGNLCLSVYEVKEEMENFEFTSDSLSCTITSVKNDVMDVVVPNYVTEIEKGAFASCSMTSLCLPFIGGSRNENAYFGYIFGADSYESNYSAVPSSLKRVEVSDACEKIDPDAFYNCYGIKNLVLPDSVTLIGSEAFKYCNGLQSVTLSSALERIEDSLFYGCTSLESVEIPSNVKEIGSSAFYDCNALSGVTFHEGLERIEASAFSYCNALSSLILPDSLEEIEGNAFYCCNSITSLTLPFVGENKESNTYLGYIFGASSYDYNNTSVPDTLRSVVLSDACGEIPDYAFYNLDCITSFTIPYCVSSIGDYAFRGCKGLTSITLPDQLSEIGASSFAYCNKLTSIALPDHLSTIGEEAFRFCTGLTSFTIPDGVTEAGMGMLRDTSITSLTLPFVGGNKESNTYLGYVFGASSYRVASAYVPSSLKSVVLSDACGKIPDYAFDGLSSITSVTLSSSVSGIGYAAFNSCTGITSMVLPEGAESIGDYAFYGCSNLISVNIPSGVERIEASTFKGCVSLKSIDIPSGTWMIGTNAFSNCTSLENIVIPDSVTDIRQGAFEGCSSLSSITLPYVGKSKTQNTYLGYVFGASSYSNNDGYVPESLKTVTLSGSYDTVESGAFYGCSHITNVILKDGIKTIGTKAFMGCSGMTSVGIPSGVSSLYSSSFKNCTSLTSIVIPDSVTTLEGYIFQGCSNLSSVTLGSGMDNISGSMFYGCSALTSILIPENVTSIGAYAFYGCSGLSSIDLGDNISSIGDYAFRGCSDLSSLTVPGSVSEIGTSAFEGCSGLTSLTLTSGIEVIYNNAFKGCSDLTSIVVPDSVTSIGSGAFGGCSNITSLTVPFTGGSAEENTYLGYIFGAMNYLGNKNYVPESLETIILSDKCESVGKNAFYSLSWITSVTIPSSVETIDSYAFDNCSSLTSVTLPDGLKTIGMFAFGGCTGLTSLTVPDSVTEIHERAFAECINLCSVTLPFTGESRDATGESALFGYVFDISDYDVQIEACQYYSPTEYRICYLPSHLASVRITSASGIPDYAFNGCSSLISITIPESVTSIGTDAFKNCYRLAEVYNLSSISITKGSTSNGYAGYYARVIHSSIEDESGLVTSNGNMYYVSGTDKIFLRPVELNDEAVTLDDDCTEIADYAFYYNEKLISVTIPSGVTKIGAYAFGDCRYLTSVILPDSVTSIGSHAFDYCLRLTSATLSKSMTSIPDNAFNYCFYLTSITIPSGVTGIGEDAFLDCYRLAEVYNLSSLSITKGSASNGYAGYYAKVIHASLTEESNLVVSNGCTYYVTDTEKTVIGLVSDIKTEVILDADCTGIADNAFMFTSITAVTIPSGVTTIGKKAFYNCNGIKTLAIPDSVTSIGSYAFWACGDLTSVTIGNGVTVIEPNAFTECIRLTSVTFSTIEGWWYCLASSDTSGTSIDVTDASVNATNLTSGYDDYYWKRS